VRTITDDYGAEFAAHSDSLAYRTIGTYVFLRTVMCSPLRASQIAHAIKLPRVASQVWNGKWPGEEDCERLGFYVNGDPDFPVQSGRFVQFQTLLREASVPIQPVHVQSPDDTK
jgi:hypothetical protein